MIKMLVSVLALGAVAFFATDASANRSGGFSRHFDAVDAYQTDTYTEVFYQGPAQIELKGDGDTDLDCAVYDGYGNLISEDLRNYDYCLLNFTVFRAGTFTVQVRNWGSVYNNYVIQMQ